MDATSTSQMFSAMVTTITDILTTNIPLVLSIVAALIGLGFLIRFVKRHVGKKA